MLQKFHDKLTKMFYEMHREKDYRSETCWIVIAIILSYRPEWKEVSKKSQMMKKMHDTEQIAETK